MKKKKISKTVCDNLQWKKHRKQCIKRAVWRITDKYTYSMSLQRRMGN